MNTNRIHRITEYETILDRAEAAVNELNAAAGRLAALKDDIARLEAYYHSAEWRADFEADEAGLLPADLKRGVLSEDAVYDLLDEYHRLINLI